jgi:hypothetical protein
LCFSFLRNEFIDIFFDLIDKFDKNRELPPHPNVVQMFGVSLDGPQPVIVLEYCAGGIKSNRIKSNYKQIFILHLIMRRKSLSQTDIHSLVLTHEFSQNFD